jgi:hypothetical protein
VQAVQCMHKHNDGTDEAVARRVVAVLQHAAKSMQGCRIRSQRPVLELTAAKVGTQPA